MFKIPTFSDKDEGQVASIKASLDDGSKLPKFISFSEMNGFIISPGEGVVGSYKVKLTIEDDYPESKSTDYYLTIVVNSQEETFDFETAFGF